MRIFTLFIFIFLVSSANYAQYGQLNYKSEVGYAVYYADYLDGRATALGEIYRANEYTCAHRTHPLGTILKVSRIDNGQTVFVRVNDRGPFNPGLIIDLSRAAAEKIDLITVGKTRVAIQVVGHSDKNPTNRSGEPQYYSRETENLIPKGLGSRDPAPQAYDDFSTRGLTAKSAGVAQGIAFLPADQRGYAIQLASFNDYTNAERQYRSWSQKGMENLYIRKEIQGGQTLYKLMIAVFTTDQKAQAYLQSVRSLYKTNGIVIKLK